MIIVSRFRQCRPVVAEILAYPATSAVSSVLIGIYIFLKRHGVSYKTVGFNYENIVTNREYWRIPISTLSHFSIIHLAFNLSRYTLCNF